MTTEQAIKVLEIEMWRLQDEGKVCILADAMEEVINAAKKEQVYEQIICSLHDEIKKMRGGQKDV